MKFSSHLLSIKCESFYVLAYDMYQKKKLPFVALELRCFDSSQDPYLYENKVAFFMNVT